METSAQLHPIVPCGLSEPREQARFVTRASHEIRAGGVNVESIDNNGILLEEDVLGGALHAFAASEWSIVSSRPSLEICYTF